MSRKYALMAALLLVLITLVSLVSAQEAGCPATYTVRYGDTLDVLAQRCNVSLEALKQANNYTKLTILYAGDTLVIPADAPPYGQFPAVRSSDSTAGQGGGLSGSEYIVQPRDTLDTIARRLDVSVVSVQKANGITNGRRLLPGTVLVIPADAPPYGQFPALQNANVSDSTLGQGGGANEHIVQRNQTLDGIAARYNVKTSCLAQANQLAKPSLLYPGQVLVIDTTCPPYDGYDVVPPQ